jgi:LCP family protein required for cell wall assembly
MTERDGGGPDRGSPLPGPRPGRYPSPGRYRTAGPARPAARPARTARLVGHISAGRRARRQRLFLVLTGALSVLALLAAGTAWAITSYVSGHFGRVDAGTAGTPSSGPLNILVAGVDMRAGLTREQRIKLHVGYAVSTNSDVLMLAHIPADHRLVEVVSIPRDSWVDIPGHGMNKINAAFGLGGPRLMVATVERATGLTINDYVEVNFLGFVKVIDALGGVNICLPFAVNDPYSGLRLTAGMHHVNGITALEFARDRHSFAASDLARIANQQQLLSSLLSEAISSGTLADPIRFEHFISAASAAITVDRGFNVVRLAQQMRGISPRDVTFTTVPLASTNYLTPTGQDAVLWNAAAARALFRSLAADRLPGRSAHHHHHHHRLHRDQVSIDVYNGTLIGGLSAGTGSQLGALGFTVHASGLDWTRHDIPQTLIEYPAGQQAGARLVRRVMPGAALHLVNGLRRIRIILGARGHQVLMPHPAGGSASGTRRSASGPGQRTAAEDACRR